MSMLALNLQLLGDYPADDPAGPDLRHKKAEQL
jgi:hypothetical protein